MLRDFKQKYIKNTYLYDLYRQLRYPPFQKIYSFWAEDFFIDKATQQITNGTYVDVGCNHPVAGSITYRLFLKGWSGVNIDFDEKNISLCKKHRPNDFSICCPVASKVETLSCYTFDAGNVLNTLDKKAADEWAAQMNKPYKVIEKQTQTLDSILQEAQIDQIDFLNIDVEGFEDEVLKGFDISKHQPKLIACEIHIINTMELEKSWAYKHLIEQDYTLISKIGPTCMFKHNTVNDIAY